MEGTKENWTNLIALRYGGNYHAYIISLMKEDQGVESTEREEGTNLLSPLVFENMQDPSTFLSCMFLMKTVQLD